MGEVKRYCLSEFAVPHSYPIEPGVYVSEDDYATLGADNANLRAELERRVPDGWKPVPISSLERMCVWIDPEPVRLPSGSTMVFRNPHAAKALREISAEFRAMLAAAPSAPKVDAVRASLSADNQRITPPDPIIAKPHPLAEISKADDPVKVQLLEALEKMLTPAVRPLSGNTLSMSPVKMVAHIEAAIAAARKGEGE